MGWLLGRNASIGDAAWLSTSLSLRVALAGVALGLCPPRHTQRKARAPFLFLSLKQLAAILTPGRAAPPSPQMLPRPSPTRAGQAQGHWHYDHPLVVVFEAAAAFPFPPLIHATHSPHPTPGA